MNTTILPMPDLIKQLNLHPLPSKSPRLLYHPDSAALLDVDEPAYFLFQEIAKGSTLTEAMDRVKSQWAEANIASLYDSLESITKYLLQWGDKNCMFNRESVIAGLLSHHPRGLMFFTTNQCNFACHYCYERYEWKNVEKHDLSEETMRLVIHDLFRRSATRKEIKITFFGGEPLLNFEIVKKAVSYSQELAKEQNKKVYFSISTNGYLMTDKVIDFLVEHRFGVLVSMDGPKEAHDRHRVLHSGEGTFDVVAKNVRKLLSLQRKKRVRPLLIRSTMTIDNNEFFELREYFSKAFPGARIMIGESMGTINHQSEHDVPALTPDALREKLDKVCEELIQCDVDRNSLRYAQMLPVISDIHQKLSRSGPTDMPYSLCGICRNEMGSSADGDYYPCHRFVGMEAFKLGDVRTGLDPDKVTQCYDAYFDQVESQCADCWAKRLCGGPCPAGVALPDGRFGDLDADRCVNLRIMYEYMLRTYWIIRSQQPEFFNKYIAGETSNEYEAMDDPKQFLSF